VCCYQFDILLDDSIYTKALRHSCYTNALFFFMPCHSAETIASFSTDGSGMVALQTALIDTAVDLCGGMRVTLCPSINVLRIRRESYPPLSDGV
jgi:hypothetical protein